MSKRERKATADIHSIVQKRQIVEKTLGERVHAMHVALRNALETDISIASVLTETETIIKEVKKAEKDAKRRGRWETIRLYDKMFCRGPHIETSQHARAREITRAVHRFVEAGGNREALENDIVPPPHWSPRYGLLFWICKDGLPGDTRLRGCLPPIDSSPWSDKSVGVTTNHAMLSGEQEDLVMRSDDEQSAANVATHTPTFAEAEAGFVLARREVRAIREELEAATIALEIQGRDETEYARNPARWERGRAYLQRRYTGELPKPARLERELTTKIEHLQEQLDAAGKRYAVAVENRPRAHIAERTRRWGAQLPERRKNARAIAALLKQIEVVLASEEPLNKALNIEIAATIAPANDPASWLGFGSKNLFLGHVRRWTAAMEKRGLL